MPDSFSAVIGFLSGLPPYAALACVIAVALAISLWRSRHNAGMGSEARRTSSYLPLSVSLSSFPPEDRSPGAAGLGRTGGGWTGDGGFGEGGFGEGVSGQIASLSTKKAVFIIPTNPFAVGHKVYFSFASSHFSGQYFSGHISKVRHDQVTDEYRLTIAVLDKPFSLSRAMLKKLMLPIAS